VNYLNRSIFGKYLLYDSEEHNASQLLSRLIGLP